MTWDDEEEVEIEEQDKMSMDGGLYYEAKDINFKRRHGDGHDILSQYAGRNNKNKKDYTRNSINRDNGSERSYKGSASSN